MAKSGKQLFSRSPYLRRKSQLSTEQLNSIDAYLHELLSQNSSQLRKTHYFHDRYENIYLHDYQLDELQQLLQESLQHAADLSAKDVDELSIGFWFNLMGPGHITDWHTHDDMDELLSGVVYLTVPPDSGNLVLKTGKGELVIEPEKGDFIFFDPVTEHAVTENRSDEYRLSIAMNIGLTANKL